MHLKKVTRSDINAVTDYLSLEELVYGVFATQAVNVGIRLELFEHIAKGTLKESLIKPRPMEMLLAVYRAMELLDQHDHIYQYVRGALVWSGPDSLGVYLDSLDDLWKSARKGDRKAMLKLALAGPQNLDFLRTPKQKFVYGISSTAAIIFAHKYSLFETLANGPITPHVVAEKAQIEFDEAESLLAFLVELGLLEKKGKEKISLRADLVPYLVKGNNYYHGPVLDIISAPWNTTRTKDLMTAVEKDAPIISDNIWKVYMNDYEADIAFQHHMFCVSWPAGVKIAKMIDFHKSKRILDIAAGQGGITIPILARHPHLTATLTEITRTDILKQKALEYGVLGRISLVNADMFTDPIPTGGDVVILSQILNDWSVEKNVSLLKKVFNALQPGGKILIHERLLLDDQSGPLLTALQNIFMLMWTEGRQYSAQEIRLMLLEARFKITSIKPTVGGFSIIEAEKPHL
jgi:2-polyprenyl-3-methyl-5-hydroxy-6-metoxy-1,4-benzoquinol methylase